MNPLFEFSRFCCCRDRVPGRELLKPATDAVDPSPSSKELTSHSSKFLYDTTSSTLSVNVCYSGCVCPHGTGQEFIPTAHDWFVNLGAPAALVAGAVVATLYENVRGGDLNVYQSDPSYTALAKKLTNILLLSAFAFQIMSMFVTTVKGTMLISRDFVPMLAELKRREGVEVATTALGFLRQHFKFDYLTARMRFLQGLLNWLADVAIEYTIPRKGQGKAGRLSFLLVLLLSFYNAHLTYYDNYLHMVCRWGTIFGNPTTKK